MCDITYVRQCFATFREGDPLKCALILHTKKFDVNSRDKYGKSPLMTTVYNASYETMKLLLDNGAWVDLEDGDGNTAMHRAILLEDIKSVEILSRYTYDKYHTNDSGYTVADTVATTCNVEILCQLVNAGLDMDVINPISGYTPLEYAIFNGNADFAKVMLRLGLAVKQGRRNLVFQAILMSDLELAEMLLERGSDVHAEDDIIFTTIWLKRNVHLDEDLLYLLAKYVKRTSPFHVTEPTISQPILLHPGGEVT